MPDDLHGYGDERRADGERFDVAFLMTSTDTSSTAAIRATDAIASPPSSAAESTGPTGLVGPARASWTAVVSLALGVFALVMAEFLPASLLTRVAGNLGVSEGVAGQSVSVTAIVAAVAGLTVPALLPRLDRRRLLLALGVLAVLSDLLVALAPNYPVLLLARVLLGVALGAFWALAISVTAHLVPPSRLGRAMTVVQIGVSLATVAAIPLGTWLGEIWGWRSVFLLAAGVGIVALVFQWTVLPGIRPSGVPGLRSLFATVRSRLILVALLATALVAGGHFAAFTYIRPAATEVGGFDAAHLALLLLVYGLAAFAGNLLAGPLVDKRARAAVLVFPVLLGAALLLFAFSNGVPALVLAATALWGLGFGGVPTSLMTWMARAEPTRLESVGGLQAAAFQVAIATGAVVGGVLVDAVSVQATLVAGGLAAAAGGLLLASLRTRR
ncbi:MFS transporter [Herbiconiux ginsengi]|uniref:MFS transporter, DHA1 family, purine ribonucleoside efflux pump n=1 Tax=Herbiconiux ginsengi TaxID=381665 RepID=A0A1H3KBQ0_9MICO|nr:MFS transporter [Herbiconiux ginsengi]SDY49596.1 MFS transporter, DHA1 family, purine ribonucleoside efflux pump [Herbiconiux ginsengi]